ncbi:hypothetical protein F2Q69_00059222 [Brassica cretica]|uniref:Uncharacterized protein n=1 Tax=Brassica cretica TaxID=69181 RepID=A0A8S9RAV6_BRACR|nr:hypothetical protein F2Q69_00059222 [Brassica cretica]
MLETKALLRQGRRSTSQTVRPKKPAHTIASQSSRRYLKENRPLRATSSSRSLTLLFQFDYFSSLSSILVGSKPQCLPLASARATICLMGFLLSPPLPFPLTTDFDGFQKEAVQMVKPAKGTTTLAFIFKEGVMVDADSMKKIIEINPYMLGPMAGGLEDYILKSILFSLN